MANILPFPVPDPSERQGQVNDRLRSDTTHRSNRQASDDGALWGDWMLLAQEGDREAYQSLLRAISPYLRAIAHRYLGRGEDSEDAVQEVLMLVNDIRHTYEYGRPFKPWLSTIASRRCIDLLRRRSRRATHEAPGQDDPYTQVADHAPGPEENMQRQFAIDRLHDAVDALTPKQQEAIRLLRLRELSLEEASSESRQTIGALKVACHRAVKALQQTFAHRGHDDE